MPENIPDKPKHLGSFTNDPNLKGQVDPDTGEPWVYTPEESYWRDYEKEPVTHPEITMEGGEEGRTTIETPTGGYSGSAEALPEARAMVEKQDKLIASGKRKRARPPEGAKGPNYTDRSGFEQQVFKKIGGNPFTTDVMAEVNKTYTQSFPDIYNRFFRGKVTWADQGKMTKDQIEEANVLRNRYRAYLHDRITSTLKAKQNDYTMMMQRFDHEAAVVKANKERLRKEQAAMRKAPEKPKEDEYKINQALDDWRANYKTRLDQLKEDYGDFNPISGLWIPNRQTYEEYKKKRQALIDEFEKGQKSIFEGKIPKRMGGAIAGERMKGDYVGSLIKQLTIGY